MAQNARSDVHVPFGGLIRIKSDFGVSGPKNSQNFARYREIPVRISQLNNSKTKEIDKIFQKNTNIK
jgi:hypothetical protein